MICQVSFRYVKRTPRRGSIFYPNHRTYFRRVKSIKTALH